MEFNPENFHKKICVIITCKSSFGTQSPLKKTCSPACAEKLLKLRYARKKARYLPKDTTHPRAYGKKIGTATEQKQFEKDYLAEDSTATIARRYDVAETFVRNTLEHHGTRMRNRKEAYAINKSKAQI